MPAWWGRRPGRLPTILGAIAFGGLLGAPARYQLGLALPDGPGGFPWATFWTNVSGSFALGVVVTLMIERWPPSRFTRSFLAIGFIGSYTTFSTYTVQADRLVGAGHLAVAASYLLGSLLAGLLAVAAGVVVARAARLRRPGGATRR